METFQEIINGNKPVLVDFSAEWCGPCKMMGPILKQVASQLGNRARILKVDVDRNPETAARYQIHSVPTLMVFKNGKVVFRKSGVIPAEQLITILNQFSNNP